MLRELCSHRACGPWRGRLQHQHHGRSFRTGCFGQRRKPDTTRRHPLAVRRPVLHRCQAVCSLSGSGAPSIPMLPHLCQRHRWSFQYRTLLLHPVKLPYAAECRRRLDSHRGSACTLQADDSHCSAPAMPQTPPCTAPGWAFGSPSSHFSTIAPIPGLQTSSKVMTLCMRLHAVAG